MTKKTNTAISSRRAADAASGVGSKSYAKALTGVIEDYYAPVEDAGAFWDAVVDREEAREQERVEKEAAQAAARGGDGDSENRDP